MVRIIAVIFILLSSLTGIDAGMRYATQTNSSRLEKRSVAMAIDNHVCDTATYREVPLYDFIYQHECFPEGWNDFLNQEEVQKLIAQISPELTEDAVKRKHKIEPPMHNMFNAFKVRRDNVKVIILGQDPTPQANQATGMAFSLKPGVDPITVPSVFNMLVELKWEGMDVGLSNGDLTPWLDEGVLLLNAALTVRQGPVSVHGGSHQRLWDKFTILLLQHISLTCQPSAWILWGKEAKKVVPFIDRGKHYIKAGGHPSSLAIKGRFFGRNYFHCANRFLDGVGRGGVRWELPRLPGLVTALEDCDADGLNDK